MAGDQLAACVELLRGQPDGPLALKLLAEAFEAQVNDLNILLASFSPTNPDFTIRYAAIQGERDGILSFSTRLANALAQKD